MDIKTFQTVAASLPADIAILLRGPTGIGKSMLASGVADHVGLPYIDVRGSTMQEGDVGGYPDIEGMKENGIMTFCMPSWFVRACNEPVVLMLDELNRALPGVMQSFFQLVLDRELGNDANGVPYRLHPETRVIAAINCGNEYTVEEMDPALLRRFWCVDIMPTTEDWIEWASGPGEIDSVIVDFVRHNPAHLRFKGQAEPDKIYPSPRSYDRLDHTLRHASMAPSEVAGDVKSNVGFYALAHGFLGTEAAISFRDFVDNYEMQVSPEDVLDGYKKNKKSLEALTNDQSNGLIAKVIEHCKQNSWTVDQCSNLAKWAKTLPGEMMVSLWNGVMETKEVKNITKLHKFLGQAVVEAVQRSRSL